MLWKQIKGADGVSVHALTVEDLTWKALGVAFSSALKTACAEFQKSYGPDEWDRVIVYVWFKNGLIDFVAQDKKSALPRRLLVQLNVPHIEKEFKALPKPDDPRSELFDELGLQQNVFQEFGKAVDSSSVTKLLRDVRKLNECRLFIQFGADLKHRQEFFFV